MSARSIITVLMAIMLAPISKAAAAPQAASLDALVRQIAIHLPASPEELAGVLDQNISSGPTIDGWNGIPIHYRTVAGQDITLSFVADTKPSIPLRIVRVLIGISPEDCLSSANFRRQLSNDWTQVPGPSPNAYVTRQKGRYIEVTDRSGTSCLAGVLIDEK